MIKNDRSGGRFQEHLRREVEIIEPEGIDKTGYAYGEEVTEQLEHKPGRTLCTPHSTL